MGIKFSRKNYNLLYRKMDRYGLADGVTLDELVMFVFPENSTIIKEEKIRLKKLQSKIRKQTIEFARIYEPHERFKKQFPDAVNGSNNSINKHPRTNSLSLQIIPSPSHR